MERKTKTTKNPLSDSILADAFEYRGSIDSTNSFEIFEVYNKQLECTQVIKLLKGHFIPSKTQEQYFIKNIVKNPATLRHERILHTETLGLDRDGSVYIVMENYNWQSIREKYSTWSKPNYGPLLPLTWEEITKIYGQILEGTAYLHSLGICHQNLTLENILLDENDNVKIADTFLSAAHDLALFVHPEKVAKNSKGEVSTTEQNPQLDLSYDVVQLGLIGFELCCGKKYNASEAKFSNSRDIWTSHLDVPQWIQSFIHTALGKDDSNIFASAEQMYKTFAENLNTPVTQSLDTTTNFVQAKRVPLQTESLLSSKISVKAVDKNEPYQALSNNLSLSKIIAITGLSKLLKGREAEVSVNISEDTPNEQLTPEQTTSRIPQAFLSPNSAWAAVICLLAANSYLFFSDINLNRESDSKAKSEKYVFAPDTNTNSLKESLLIESPERPRAKLATNYPLNQEILNQETSNHETIPQEVQGQNYQYDPTDLTQKEETALEPQKNVVAEEKKLPKMLPGEISELNSNKRYPGKISLYFPNDSRKLEGKINYQKVNKLRWTAVLPDVIAKGDQRTYSQYLQNFVLKVFDPTKETTLGSFKASSLLLSGNSKNRQIHIGGNVEGINQDRIAGDNLKLLVSFKGKTLGKREIELSFR